ncbi:response regulator [Phormidium tenue FACHB-886]|nr:response regulator [Phormidium tenue FACHB-886]
MSARVLVAEDEILIARKIEATLQQLGYVTAAIAIDAESAIQKIAETKPDLVLMDILMPGEMDGIEAAIQIRTRFQIPVVYLTAYGDADTLARAKRAEPFGYILKPFQAQELDATIQVALNRHAVEQQRLNALRNIIPAALLHEVNTPLNGIIAGAELAAKSYDSFSRVEILELLDCIYLSAVRLDKVSQNILLHIKLEIISTDPSAVEQLRQDCVQTSQSVIATLAGQIATEATRSPDLQLELEDGSVQISEIHLKKIVTELLDNAFKFSPPDTAVTLRSSFQQSVFVLTVSDRGRGLAPEQLANVGAYLQFDRQLYEQQGVGLGLSLTKRLTELQGGEFLMESTPTQGTTVTVKLPVASKNSSCLSHTISK